MRCPLNSKQDVQYAIQYKIQPQAARNYPPTACTRKPATLKFDVMLQGRWVCTMQMPLGLPVDYVGDKPVFALHRGQVKQYVEQQKPSLIGKPWSWELVTKETKDLWRE